MIKKISIILYLSIFTFTGISVFLDISFWKDNTSILDFVPTIISNILFGKAVLMICTLCSILKMGFSLYTYLWDLSLTTSSFHVH